jgi:hypothetical protein
MDNQVPNPIPSYIAAILRTVGALVAGYAIAKGYITAEQAPQIGGAILALIVAGWSIFQKVNAHGAFKAAVAAPAGFVK